MASREKDQADFDLETFVDLFDTAMASDNPAVQRALKNLLMIAALVNAESNKDGLQRGPLRRVFEDIKYLNQRLQNLEMEKQYRSTYTPTMPSSPGTGQWPPSVTYPPGYVSIPSQPLGPATMPGTSLPPGYTWNPGTSTTSLSGGANTATTYAADALLEKLEIKTK